MKTVNLTFQANIPPLPLKTVNTSLNSNFACTFSLSVDIMRSHIEPGYAPGINRGQKPGKNPVTPDKNRVYVFRGPDYEQDKTLTEPR